MRIQSKKQLYQTATNIANMSSTINEEALKAELTIVTKQISIIASLLTEKYLNKEYTSTVGQLLYSCSILYEIITDLKALL